VMPEDFSKSASTFLSTPKESWVISVTLPPAGATVTGAEVPGAALGDAEVPGAALGDAEVADAVADPAGVLDGVGEVAAAAGDAVLPVPHAVTEASTASRNALPHHRALVLFIFSASPWRVVGTGAVKSDVPSPA